MAEHRQLQMCVSMLDPKTATNCAPPGSLRHFLNIYPEYIAAKLSYLLDLNIQRGHLHFLTLKKKNCISAQKVGRLQL